VRKPHISIADLLTWSEVPPSESLATVSGARSHQVPNFSLSQLKNVLLGLFTFTHCVCVSVFALILNRPIRSTKSSMEVNSLTKKLKSH